MSDKNTSECEQNAGLFSALEMASQLVSICDGLERSWPHLKVRLGFSGAAEESGHLIRTQADAGFAMVLDLSTHCSACWKNLFLAKQLLSKMFGEASTESIVWDRQQ